MSQPVDPRWYETFFQGIALDLWRNAVGPRQTVAEAGFLVRELRLAPGARVLDVPCGNGRHALELARRGFRVTGIDLSEEFLAEARAEARKAGLEAEWRRDDMRCIPRAACYQGAYCFGNSFGYLEHAGTREFLAAVAAALEPGARFALDTGGAAESVIPDLEELMEMQVGDVHMRARNHYRCETSRLETEFTFSRDGREETRLCSQQVFTVGELGRLLEEAGLRACGWYSGTESEAFRLGSQRLLLVAEKQ